jgi:2-oxoglutarate ferredoxin oxidoreductase subunit alpha
VENRRARGEKLGLLELQTLWPFPGDLVRERCSGVHYIIVVEMNMGQILGEVKKVVKNPNRVFLANRIDGGFITPADLLNILRITKGKGV